MSTAAMPRRGLYAITGSGHRDPADLAQRVRGAIAGGARMIQYRAKDLPPDRRLLEALSVLAVCAAADVPLIINDDVALAAGTGAAGVHLGIEDTAPEIAREVLGPDAIIGVTCHADLDRARAARQVGADYVAFGSFFASPTKPGAVRAPVELLGRAQELGLPLVAIGGITPDNGATLIRAGASFLAVISGVFDQPDPAAAARRYARLFQENPSERP